MKRFLNYLVLISLGVIPFTSKNPVSKTSLQHDEDYSITEKVIRVEKELPKSITPVEEPTKTNWSVKSSPHSRVPVERVNTALAHYQDMGMSKQGAAYLVGNFIGESNLVPCGNYGDGGKAHGLGQWHPNRRKDMPCDFAEQLTWAVNTEMARDTPGLKEVLFDHNASTTSIKDFIYRWERYSIQGARWNYAQAIYNQL